MGIGGSELSKGEYLAFEQRVLLGPPFFFYVLGYGVKRKDRISLDAVLIRYLVVPTSGLWYDFCSDRLRMVLMPRHSADGIAKLKAHLSS